MKEVKIIAAAIDVGNGDTWLSFYLTKESLEKECNDISQNYMIVEPNGQGCTYQWVTTIEGSKEHKEALENG